MFCTRPALIIDDRSEPHQSSGKIHMLSTCETEGECEWNMSAVEITPHSIVPASSFHQSLVLSLSLPCEDQHCSDCCHVQYVLLKKKFNQILSE